MRIVLQPSSFKAYQSSLASYPSLRKGSSAAPPAEIPSAASSTSGVAGKSSAQDPKIRYCPFELDKGACADKKCPFNHFNR